MITEKFKKNRQFLNVLKLAYLTQSEEDHGSHPWVSIFYLSKSENQKFKNLDKMVRTLWCRSLLQKINLQNFWFLTILG